MGASGSRQRQAASRNVVDSIPRGQERGWGQSASGPSAGGSSAGGSATFDDGPHSVLWRKHLVEVIPGLWLGSREAACNLSVLKQAGVQGCVNCTTQPNLLPEAFSYLHVDVSDTPEENLLPAHLERVVKWVQQHISAGRSVFVHCHAGVSRSPTIVIGLLLHLRGMSLIDAWNHVKRLRPSVRPNAGFCQQLCDRERSLYGRNTAVIGLSKRDALVPATQGPTGSIPSHRVI